MSRQTAVRMQSAPTPTMKKELQGFSHQNCHTQCCSSVHHEHFIHTPAQAALDALFRNSHAQTTKAGRQDTDDSCTRDAYIACIELQRIKKLPHIRALHTPSERARSCSGARSAATTRLTRPHGTCLPPAAAAASLVHTRTMPKQPPEWQLRSIRDFEQASSTPCCSFTARLGNSKQNTSA
jgi:hypothetical protein